MFRPKHPIYATGDLYRYDNDYALRFLEECLKVEGALDGLVQGTAATSSRKAALRIALTTSSPRPSSVGIWEKVN